MAWNWFHKEILPFMAMVSAECGAVGVNTLFKAASLKGMSFYVFIFYSYAFVTLLLLPVPFIFRSEVVSSTFKFRFFWRICVLSLIGFLAQIVGTNGLEYSSPTLASAMSNLTPAFTFFFAVAFRMEKVAISKRSSQAKIIGTITSIGGALLAVLYKGPTILSTSNPRPTTISLTKRHLISSPDSDWLIGGALLATKSLLGSLWYILQSQIMKICPIELLVTFIFTSCAAIISAPVCFAAENNLNSWRLKPDIALVAILVSAIFERCYNTIVHSWGLRLKGPVYVVIYKPLSIAIAAFIGVIFLGEALHFGTIVGGIVISIGFYTVMWGKANEEKSSEDYGSSNMTHFLQIPIEDI